MTSLDHSYISFSLLCTILYHAPRTKTASSRAGCQAWMSGNSIFAQIATALFPKKNFQDKVVNTVEYLALDKAVKLGSENLWLEGSKKKKTTKIGISAKIRSRLATISETCTALWKFFFCFFVFLGRISRKALPVRGAVSTAPIFAFEVHTYWQLEAN